MERVELGKVPISEANPAGDDVRFEPEYEELETELGKLSSPTASGTVDWDRIVKLSTTILGEKSKNLTVATYLSVGLLECEGIGGLSDGIQVLRDLLENFWENMYPPKKRMRGRMNAFVWWHERIDAKTADLSPETWPQAKRDAFQENLAFIDSFLAEKTEDAPLLRSMNDRLLGLIEIEPEPVPEPESGGEAASPDGAKKEPGEAPSPGPVKTAPKPAPKAETAPETDVSGDDGEKLLKQGLDILGKASTLLLKKEPLTSVPFRINRLVAWLPVQNVPPATDGKTMIPPPDEQIISSLNSLSQSQNWRELLQAAESRIRQFLFWLDLHRYVAESLEQLRYPVISECVASETLRYVKRLTDVEKLSFSDGTPFADDETKEWLKSAAEQSGGMSSRSSGGSGVEQLVENEISEAQKLIKENKMNVALGGFIAKVNQASSVRDRFLWKIGMCRLLLRVKKPQLVIPYIQEILGILDEYKIEQWEPDLAVEGLSLVLSGLRLQGEKKDDELIEKALNRISVLNPARAFELL